MPRSRPWHACPPRSNTPTPLASTGPQELFERDVDCLVRFFSKKLGYVPSMDPDLPRVRPDFQVGAAVPLGLEFGRGLCSLVGRRALKSGVCLGSQ